MTPDEKRRGFLMLSAVHRPVTDEEREELVSLLVPVPPDSGFVALLEASSLGTDEAKELRESVSDEKAQELVRRANSISPESGEADR